LLLLAGEHAAALSAIERAITLNPNCAHAWRESGVVNCLANRPDAAIASAQRAIRLSPLDPHGHNFKWVMGYGLMLGGRYQEAMEWVEQSLHDLPEHHPAIRGKVALCGYLGRVDEGPDWIRRLLKANPAMTIAGFKTFAAKFMVPGTIAIWEEGFRKAGLPEE
jgi:adenylate cyclase